jgi:hypothetical protein
MHGGTRCCSITAPLLRLLNQSRSRKSLTGQFDPNWVKDRVVLIGVTAASIQDYHDTPYGRVRGLEVHAHLISQILSAVEDGRPLIWWLPQWGDALWVWVWSATGGVLVYQVRAQSLRKAQLLLLLVLTVSLCVTVLYGLCWVFLLQGGWLPLVPSCISHSTYRWCDRLPAISTPAATVGTPVLKIELRSQESEIFGVSHTAAIMLNFVSLVEILELFY